jgi:hypothetical protein
MAWRTLKFREPKIESWSDRYFPTFMIGMIIFVVLFLFSTAIHLCCEKISNEASYKYRVDIHGANSIYLNEGEFELKDGRISFEKDGTMYYFTNFRLTDISK